MIITTRSNSGASCSWNGHVKVMKFSPSCKISGCAFTKKKLPSIKFCFCFDCLSKTHFCLIFTAALSNLIEFGDCHVREEKNLIFAITNHSDTDAVRFQWPENHEQLKFSPAVGHLHAGCAKDITVTFKTNSSKTLNQESIGCKVSKISFDGPVDQVRGLLNAYNTQIQIFHLVVLSSCWYHFIVQYSVAFCW